MSSFGRLIRSLPVGQKLAVAIIGLSAGVFVLTSAIIVSQSLHEKTESLARNLNLTAQIIGDNGADALDRADPEAASEALLPLLSNSAIRMGCLYDRGHMLLAEYAVSGGACPRKLAPDAPAGTAIARAERLEDVFTTGLKGSTSAPSEDLLTVTYPVTMESRHIGTLYLASDMSERQGFVRTLLYAVATAVLLSAILVILVMRGLRRMIADPILNLTRVAKDFTLMRNHDRRAESEPGDEFSALAHTFNEMLETVRRHEAAMKESHAAALAAKAAVERARAERF